MLDLVAIDVSLPTGEIPAVEDSLKTLARSQNFVGFVGRNFANEDVPPADLAAMGLQLNGTGAELRPAAIPVVLHGGVVDDQSVVQPDIRAGTHLANTEHVPLAERLIGQHKRLLARRSPGVVEQPARSFVGSTVPLAACASKVPDLHLRISAQVDAAVGFSHRLVFDQQLKISELAVGGEVWPFAAIHQFTVFDPPVFDRFLPPAVQRLPALLIVHCGKLSRVEMRPSMPAGQIVCIEQYGEAFRRHGVSKRSRNRKCKADEHGDRSY